MWLQRRARLAGALAVFLVGCTPAAPSPTPSATPSPPPVVPSTLTSPSATPSPDLITVWVPPFLEASSSTTAGALLADRLAQFEADQPGVRVQLRLKETSGPAGLLESLRAATAVAPAALPDLIALTASDLATAADEGLVDAYPAGLPPQTTSWLSFAVEGASPAGVLYGVPLAAQTDVIVYDVPSFARAPADWSDLIGGPAPFLFPAADPRASFTLAQYLALGGQLTQADGSPALDPSVLEEVLTFYGSAYNAGVLPLTSRQYESSAQTWSAFQQRRAASAVAPLEAWLADPLSGASAAPLPTRDGAGVTVATTWTWAVVTRDPETQSVLVELVEWLSDPEFTGPWTHSLRRMPVQAAALAAWPDGPARLLVQQLAAVARAAPPQTLLDVVGPPTRRAVDAVLSGAQPPQAAALTASMEVVAP